MDTSLASHASAPAGVVVPFLTQLVKLKVLRVSDRLAHLVSLILAFRAVAVVRSGLRQRISPAELVPDAPIALAVASTIYHQLAGTPAAKLLTPGRPAPGDQAP